MGVGDVVNAAGKVNQAKKAWDTAESANETRKVFQDPNSTNADKAKAVIDTAGTALPVTEKTKEDVKELVDLGSKINDGTGVNGQKEKQQGLQGENTDNSANEKGYTGFHKEDPHNSMKEKADSYPNSMVETDYSSPHLKDPAQLERYKKDVENAFDGKNTNENLKKIYEDLENGKYGEFEKTETNNSKSDDGNKLKMDTPNLDNQPKDTPKGDDDGKSGWEQFWDNPVDFFKKQWDKLTGNDKDDNQSDNQLAKDTPNLDNNGKDPAGENNPDGSQADNPKGKGEENPNAGKDGEDGQGAGGATGGGSQGGGQDNPDNPEKPDNPDNPSKGDPLKLPGAGGGHTGGLHGGGGAGTLGAGDPSAPVADPLLIGLEPNGNAHYGKDYATISVTSYDEENGGKWLDINGDGISNNVSWIAKGTGALFYDENNNGKLDGFNELLRDGVKTDNGEVSENGFDYVLKFLDSNGDKMLDAQDENFNKVKVLSLDEDNNEVVQSLKDLEVKSLDLNYQEFDHDKQYYYNLKGGSFVTHESTYTKEDGSTGKLADVNLSYDTVNTQHADNIELTAEQAEVAN